MIGLTATPHAKTPEDQIAFRYPLAAAIADKLVKTPLLVGRREDKSDATTKLLDGIALLRLKENAIASYRDRRVHSRSDDGAQAVGGVVRRDVVHVAHRRRDVGVAGVRLDLVEPVGADGHRAVGVAEVVDPDPLELGGVERRQHPAPERGLLDHLGGRVDEHEVGGVGEVLAL